MQLSKREFENRGALESAAYQLLESALCESAGERKVIMLTGGSTPFGVYEQLRLSGKRAASGVTVMLSDERYVPIEDETSNYGRMLPMLEALGVDEALHVDSSVPIAVAASRYEQAVQDVIDSQLSFELGILGLGGDGHVAALFSQEQIDSGKERLAVAVNRPDGMTGISLTPAVLCKFKRLVFWVCGGSKQDAVDALEHEPFRIPAGIALDAAPNVELWYSPSN